MSPESAVARGVRIAIFIGILMMNAMRRHPEERASFQRQGSAYGQKIFDPFVSLVSAMREQAVIAHADAQAAGHPIQKHRQRQIFPAEHEQRSDGANVKRKHEKSGDPASVLAKRAG